MKMQVSAQVLLIVAIVLLAANLVVMFAVNGATPAHAAGNVVAGATYVTGYGLVRVWSNGVAEFKEAGNGHWTRW